MPEPEHHQPSVGDVVMTGGGFFVGYIAELNDDSEGPQLMEWSGTVLPTEDDAREQHSEAQGWRPGWRIYALTDITDQENQ